MATAEVPKRPPVDQGSSTRRRIAPASTLRHAASGDRENGGYSPVPGIVALFVIYLVFASLYHEMTSGYTLYSIMLQMGSYGFVALGVTLVLIIGEIDLSIGSVAGLGSAVAGVLVTTHGYPWWVAIAAAIVSGLLAGLLQGLIVTLLEVPSFVITLGGLLAWQGVQLSVLHNETVIVENHALNAFGADAVPKTLSWILGGAIVAVTAAQRIGPLLRKEVTLRVALRPLAEALAIAAVVIGGMVALNRNRGVPISMWLLITLIAITGFVLQHTRGGRAVYAIGGSSEAARRAGFRPNLVRVVVFALSGGFAALGGVYIMARGAAADTLIGTGDLVLAGIAAAVIGGCSLFGGRGSPWAALIGTAVLTTLVMGLYIGNRGANLQLILEGVILVAAVAVDAIMRRRLITRHAFRRTAHGATSTEGG
jgi:D-xylose transport system permease protein